MMFSDYKDVIEPNKPQGQGSIIIGNQFKSIIVPTVWDDNKLKDSILSAVNCPKDESH